MWIVLARRLLAVPPLLLVISFLTYALLGVSPGDYFAQKEQDQKYSFHRVMELRAKVGKVARVPDARRAEVMPTFTVGQRRYEYTAQGALLRDGNPCDPKLEQAQIKRFEKDGTRWSVSEEGALYRWVGFGEGYLRWLWNAVRLDLGESFSQERDVLAVMGERIWATLLLEIVALTIAWGLAIPLGVWSGVRPNSTLDHICGAIAYVSLSVPGVFLSLLALLFALATGWFPIGDMRSLDYERLGPVEKVLDVAHHMILPSAVIGVTSIAIYMRQMRGQMVEAMSSDYVRTARAKGLSTRAVQFRHALRNAINPLVTMFGFSLAALLGGSFLVELIFNWPGLAQITTSAVISKDEPLVMASVLFSALLLVAGNVVADMLLAIVDPRIRAA
ncbi:MAG: hypothetical protein HMLKMBBP_00808 [Planctomycetes bacterium]|nr:hypothetical protein [Planctomycetota bacterium]